MFKVFANFIEDLCTPVEEEVSEAQARDILREIDPSADEKTIKRDAKRLSLTINVDLDRQKKQAEKTKKSL